MKPQKSILTVLLLFLALTTTAQQGINYKALIKDGSGNVLASSPISIQFIIYQGAALTNNVYQESHTVNTDTNGFVIVNIGEGTTSDVFANINWGADQHFLNVQVNTGSGLVDLGTTEFMTVPYAKHATTAANVTGLEKITENGKTGWRLVGRDPVKYGDIGNNATDLSSTLNPSSTMGATGTDSFATGEETTASGNYSTAMGEGTGALGLYSTAMGNGTTASGDSSTAMGTGTTASGVRSTAMGYVTSASGDNSAALGFYTLAGAINSTAIGFFNIGGGNPSTYVSTDPLFEVGNGGGLSTRSNALTVLQNGTITAPSLTNALITTAGAKALITKEYADTNLTASGLEVITEGGFSGRRLIGQNPANYGNIGFLAVDLSNSTSLSTTKGATNNHALATGFSTTASGLATTAMGNNTKADAFSSTAIGSYNIGGGNATTWVATDPLFEIGNGTSSTRSNALTVLKNGNVGIGTATPTHLLDLNGKSSQPLLKFYDDNSGKTSSDGFVVGLGNINQAFVYNYENTPMFFATNNQYRMTIAADGNLGIGTTSPSSKLDVNGVIRAQNNVWPTTGAGVEIAYDSSLGKGYVQSYDRGSSAWKDLVLGAFDVYPINDNFTNLGIPTNRWTAVYAVNGTIQTSDRRMKKEINNITYGLNTVLKLRPVSYKWKKGNQNVNLGLIAQEVQKLIPEVVDVGTDEDKTLGMNYSELIPILIKAIQEQQDIIEQQKNKNQQLSAELTTQNKNIENLVKRMNVLEANNQ